MGGGGGGGAFKLYLVFLMLHNSITIFSRKKKKKNYQMFDNLHVKFNINHTLFKFLIFNHLDILLA